MPGADPETYKSLYRVGDMSPLFFSFSKKLFILVSMLRINLDMEAIIISNLEFPSIRLVILTIFSALSKITTPLPLSGLETIVSLLLASSFTFCKSSLVKMGENTL